MSKNTTKIGVLIEVEIEGSSAAAITQGYSSLRAKLQNYAAYISQDNNAIIEDSYVLDPSSTQLAYERLKSANKTKSRDVEVPLTVTTPSAIKSTQIDIQPGSAATLLARFDRISEKTKVLTLTIAEMTGEFTTQELADKAKLDLAQVSSWLSANKTKLKELVSPKKGVYKLQELGVS
jgi:hypothetical protein